MHTVVLDFQKVSESILLGRRKSNLGWLVVKKWADSHKTVPLIQQPWLKGSKRSISRFFPTDSNDFTMTGATCEYQPPGPGTITADCFHASCDSLGWFRRMVSKLLMVTILSYKIFCHCFK